MPDNEGVGGMEGSGECAEKRGAEGEQRLLDGVGTECCVLCTPPPVDPSENVTLMNLRPKTGYSVRVQLSRPGEGGEGAWGPPTLMTTDCPGERPRVTLFCPPGVTVPCALGLSQLVGPGGPCLSHWRLSLGVQHPVRPPGPTRQF